MNPSVICTREPWCACDVAFMSILYWVKVVAGSTGAHQEAECARSRRQRRCANAHTLRLFCLVDFMVLLELHVIGNRLHAVDGTRHPNGALDIGA